MTSLDLTAALERLDALVDWERRARTVAMRQDLAPTRDLLERLGSPEQGLSVVHVGGTKGKGSVAALVDAGLRHAGLSVGRYLSPHVERMNERIAVNGRDVADADLALALTRALDARDAAVAAGTSGADSSWFDVVTSAAFVTFRLRGVSWAVVEVGLGGRLDSTNVVRPTVSVITSIDLEHTEILGATRAAIAAEKAGIVKEESTLVTGVPPAPDEAGLVIDARCADLGVPVVRPADVSRFGRAPVQARNLELARLALDALGLRGETSAAGQPLGRLSLDDSTAVSAALPGRGERVRIRGRTVVLDGAHTPESVRALLDDFAEDAGGRPVVVLALRRDKDLEGVLKALAGRADTVVCTALGTDLFVSPPQMAERAREVGLSAETAASSRAALRRSLALTPEGGCVLATGSLYLAGELRPLLIPAQPDDAC